ncbi:hypothetical protein ACQEXU_13225 [Vibrio sp. TRT 21S02]|uniref:hypothetical protein n=1 Tax=Vibrio sp. TRT 21S02 TaxID=3418507 RepID=UPI003CF2A5B0
MSWSDFFQSALNEGLNAYGEVGKAEAAAEAEKWKYLQSQNTIPQNTGDPNEFREVEPAKGQDSDGTTLVQTANQKYGGLPLWAWGGMAMTFFLIVLVVVLSGSRRR